MSASRRLTLGLALLAAIAAVAFSVFSGAPAAAPPPQAQGNAYGNLGVVGVDHAGITVPDIDQAIAWFHDVMGCETPLTFGPFSGQSGAIFSTSIRPAVDRGGSARPLRPERQHRALPVRRARPAPRRPPRNSDYAGHHIAFYVTDLVAADGLPRGQGRPVACWSAPRDRGPRGRADDQLLPGAVGDVHRADQLSERNGVRVRPEPAALVARSGTVSTPVVTSVPGLLGIDHVGITVPERRRRGYPGSRTCSAARHRWRSGRSAGVGAR